MIETFQKKKNYALFDKFWYLKRSEGFNKLDYDGFFVDDWGNVAEKMQTNNLLQRG